MVSQGAEKDHSAVKGKIVLTGPESSGKTTLAIDLSRHFHAAMVPEMARSYLGDGRDKYEYGDLLEIARLQVAEEERLAMSGSDLLICDTDLLTIKIWSLDKFGRCDPWILAQIAARRYDMHFLCTPDFPWQPDPLREDPGRRAFLFDWYRRELTGADIHLTVLQGPHAQRLRESYTWIQEHLLQSSV